MDLQTLNTIVRLKTSGIYDLIEISHTAFTQTYYFINNTESVTVEGREYVAFPFSLTQSPKGKAIGANITFVNADKTIAEEISNAVSENANESIILIHKRVIIEKTDLEFGVGTVQTQGTFELTSPTIEKESVSAGLTFRTSLPYNMSSLTYNKSLFPNLYL